MDVIFKCPPSWEMIYHKIHICNIYGLHELYECISSNVHEKIIYHKIHICNLYGLHELYGWMWFSNALHHEKMVIFVVFLNCRNMNYLFWREKITFHLSNIFRFWKLHGKIVFCFRSKWLQLTIFLKYLGQTNIDYLLNPK